VRADERRAPVRRRGVPSRVAVHAARFDVYEGSASAWRLRTDLRGHPPSPAEASALQGVPVRPSDAQDAASAEVLHLYGFEPGRAPRGRTIRNRGLKWGCRRRSPTRRYEVDERGRRIPGTLSGRVSQRRAPRGAVSGRSTGETPSPSTGPCGIPMGRQRARVYGQALPSTVSQARHAGIVAPCGPAGATPA